jgi:hypothetical protein
MKFETYELAKAHLKELGYYFLSGNEIFAIFVNATGNTAFSWQNGINESDGCSIEIKK